MRCGIDSERGKRERERERVNKETITTLLSSS
jgi:hypothetical protein